MTVDLQSTRVPVKATTYSPNPGTPAFLPGRTVTDGISTSVVSAVLDDGTYLICLPVGAGEMPLTVSATAASLRAVNPDRPTLAHDELYAHELGRILAGRAGREFDYDDPNREVGWREAARDELRELDAAALRAKHTRCAYTFVVDPSGVRREGRTEWWPGDRLITCTFYADGPGTAYCGPHREQMKAGDKGSIYCPTPDGLEPPFGTGPILGVPVSPFERVPALVQVAA